jgi:hypothetical protein
MRKFVFITFGGPKERFKNPLVRIYNEAKNFSVFDEIYCFDDSDLKKDEIFWNKHGSFIEKNYKGYGYWIWKPYLIHKKLNELNEGDILVYADCGCEININGKKRFNEYIDMLDNNENNYGIISFQMEHLEKLWTKKAILQWFEADENIKNTGQCIGGIQIIKKNEHSINIINEWLNNIKYEFINDTRNDEEPYFIENRHDQSIYSIIVKKYGSIKLSDETWFHDWNNGINYPILAKRNK